MTTTEQRPATVEYVVPPEHVIRAEANAVLDTEGRTFLDRLTGLLNGYLQLVAANRSDKPDDVDWLPQTLRWLYVDPERTDLLNAIVERTRQQRDAHGNVYISAALYKTKEESLSRCNASHVVLVEDGPRDPALPYSMLVQTSEGKYQGYYLLDKPASLTDWRELRRRATYALGGDTACLNYNRVVRIPGTINTKRSGSFVVRLVYSDGPIYTVEQLRAALPEAPAAAVHADGVTPLERNVIEKELGDLLPLMQRLEAYRCKKPTAIGFQVLSEPGRFGSASQARWQVVGLLVALGYPDSEIGAMLWYWTEETRQLPWGHKDARSVEDKLRWIATDIANKRADMAAKGYNITPVPTGKRTIRDAKPLRKAQGRKLKEECISLETARLWLRENPDAKQQHMATAWNVSTRQVRRILTTLRQEDISVMSASKNVVLTQQEAAQIEHKDIYTPARCVAPCDACASTAPSVAEMSAVDGVSISASTEALEQARDAALAAAAAVSLSTSQQGPTDTDTQVSVPDSLTIERLRRFYEYKGWKPYHWFDMHIGAMVLEAIEALPTKRLDKATGEMDAAWNITFSRVAEYTQAHFDTPDTAVLKRHYTWIKKHFETFFDEVQQLPEDKLRTRIRTADADIARLQSEIDAREMKFFTGEYFYEGLRKRRAFVVVPMQDEDVKRHESEIAQIQGRLKVYSKELGDKQTAERERIEQVVKARDEQQPKAAATAQVEQITLFADEVLTGQALHSALAYALIDAGLIDEESPYQYKTDAEKLCRYIELTQQGKSQSRPAMAAD